MNNLPSTPGPEICLIGNLNIDLIIRNIPDLPKWGQEVAGTSRMLFSSGQAGYTAFALSRLGVPLSLIANIGDDLFARQILDDLAASGVPLGGVERVAGGQTGISVAVVREDGERAFLSEFGCMAAFNLNNILHNWPLVQEAKLVALVGLFCLRGLPPASAHFAFQQAQAEGKQTFLDTGWDSENWPASTVQEIKRLLGAVNIFAPNQDEARAITGLDSPQEAARALQELGPEMVIIKCGAQGSYTRYGRSEFFQPAFQVNVFDAVGAGDTFNAGFLLGYLRGWPMPPCLALGAMTAALYISRSQNRFPSLAEVIQSAQTHQWITADILNSISEKGSQ